MDWELYERQRATLVLIGVAIISFLLLAFQQSSAVQHIKAFFVSCTFPTQRIFSEWTTASSAEKPVVPTPTTVEEGSVTPPSVGAVDGHAEQARALRVLVDENTRLNSLLELKHERWPRMIAARVVSRDPQRWFQEILLDKGREEGLQVDDPIIALSGNREALVGRIVETGAHTARVMLIHDSLSSVPATVIPHQTPGETSKEDASETAGEDGVVEGSNSHDLYMKYLIRDSHVKIGDSVVTSGLGGMFPPGVQIGWIQEIGLDPRQLFLQARLRPAMVSFPLRTVGVLVKKE